jgi:hypothetical protein
MKKRVSHLLMVFIDDIANAAVAAIAVVQNILISQDDCMYSVAVFLR